MKNLKQQDEQLKGRKFNERYYPKFKRIRTEPRCHIRRLLRSFLPLHNTEDPVIDDKHSST